MATVTKLTSTPAWDSGARTIGGFSGDGALVFSVGQAIGIVCGLNSQDNNASYFEIDHAFLIESTWFQVLENGVPKTSASAYSSTAVFKIERINEQVRYLVDGALVYTSATPSIGTVFGDSSLFAYQDSIIDVEVLDYADPTIDPALKEGTNYGVASLGPLATVGSDADVAVGSADLGPIQATGDELWVAQGSADLGPIGAAGADANTTFGVANLGPISASGSDALIIPEYNVGYADLGPLSAVGYEVIDTTSGSADLGPIGAVGADANVAVGAASLGPISAGGREAITNALIAAWPTWQSSILQLDSNATNVHAVFEFDWPEFEGAFVIDSNPITYAFDWPVFEGQFFGASRYQFDWPAFEGSFSIVPPKTLDFAFDWPAFEGHFDLLEGSVLSFSFDWPAFEGQFYGAVRYQFDWPAFEGSFSVLPGDVITYAFDWPTFEGHWTTGGVIPLTYSFDWPAFEGRFGRYAEAFDWPVFTGAFTFAAPVVTDADCYVVNLDTGAVTQWLTGAVTKFATAHGKLYAIVNGDLVVYDSATDNGAQIPVTLRFAQQDFGTLNAKRADVVYLECREDDGIDLSVIADETRSYPYTTPTDSARAMGTHKVKIGRGIKFHTMGLVVKNKAGGRLDLRRLEIVVQNLSPRPKT